MKILSSKAFQALVGIFLIIATAIASHAILISGGFELLDSDILPINRVANGFREGRWSAFYLDMSYAGTAHSYVRALFTAIWERLSDAPLDYMTSHLVFTYIFNPALLGVSAALLVSSYCSRIAGLIVGMLVAFGLQFLVTQYPNDTYIAYLTLGCVLLAWKSRLKNPLMDLSPAKLIAAGILSGFSIYTSRASLFYVLPFFLEWSWFKEEIRRLLHPADRTEKILLGTAIGLTALFLYLDVFGTNLGTILGKTVKLSAPPNLKIAVFLLLLLEAKIRLRDLKPEFRRRAALLGTGALIGLLPELMYLWNLASTPKAGVGQLVDFPRSLVGLGTLPEVFREIITAGPDLKRNASILLAFFGVLALLKNLRKDPRFQTVAMVGALSIFAFCRYETYVFATPRYLLPVIPVIWIAWGCLFDQIIESRRPALIALGGVLLLFHGTHHWDARVAAAASSADHAHLQRGLKIIEQFQKADITTVVSDNYKWASHNFTWLSREKIHFEPPAGPAVRDIASIEKVNALPRVGFIVPISGNSPDLKTREFYGKAWTLTYLATVEDRILFTGTPQK